MPHEPGYQFGSRSTSLFFDFDSETPCGDTVGAEAGGVGGARLELALRRHVFFSVVNGQHSAATLFLYTYVPFRMPSPGFFSGFPSGAV